MVTGESGNSNTPRQRERSNRIWFSGAHFWEQLHHVYVMLALIGLVGSLFLSSNTKETLLLASLCVYVIIIAVFAAGSTYVNGNKARYAPVMQHLHSGQHALRDLRLLMRSPSLQSDQHLPELIIRELQRVLDSLRSSLEIVTGTVIECRIELVDRPATSNNGDDFRTYPLVRDSVSSPRRQHMDENARLDPHPLMDGTPYQQLMSSRANRGTHYCCQDIGGNADFMCVYFHRFPQDLRPRSTLVWPIRYKWRGGEKRVEIVGFLHAESANAAAFSRQFDLELGALFADSLFDVVFDYVKTRKDVTHAIRT